MKKPLPVAPASGMLTTAMALFCYRNLARLWALIFCLVALSFVLMPERAGITLTALAATLGLRGSIETPAGSLWHVLAISLMVAVTLCAWFSAKHPEEKGTFIALLAAKLASTLGFVVLALTLASAWWLAAVADGFVALTLWLSYRKSCCAQP